MYPARNGFVYHSLFIIMQQLYEFHMMAVPSDQEKKKQFAEALMEFRVSLKQYKGAYEMAEVTL